MNNEELLGALARGYCTKRNSQKVLDPDLIQDMAKEVEKLANPLEPIDDIWNKIYDKAVEICRGKYRSCGAQKICDKESLFCWNILKQAIEATKFGIKKEA